MSSRYKLRTVAKFNSFNLLVSNSSGRFYFDKLIYFHKLRIIRFRKRIGKKQLNSNCRASCEPFSLTSFANSTYSIEHRSIESDLNLIYEFVIKYTSLFRLFLIQKLRNEPVKNSVKPFFLHPDSSTVNDVQPDTRTYSLAQIRTIIKKVKENPTGEVNPQNQLNKMTGIIEHLIESRKIYESNVKQNVAAQSRTGTSTYCANFHEIARQLIYSPKVSSSKLNRKSSICSNTFSHGHSIVNSNRPRERVYDRPVDEGENKSELLMAELKIILEKRNKQLSITND